MYLMKLSVLLVSSLLLTACTTRGTEATPIVQELIIIPPDIARPIVTKPVDFIVVTSDNREKLDSEPVWYAITTDSYENLAYNIQELIRYISQQQSQINYYRTMTSN